MTITEWIIQLSIFGVLALAVIGTVQNLVDAIKKKN
jgi:type II secretory pathway pseudopilin PulG